MPHIHCYLGNPSLVWTMFASDLLIGIAYLTISLMLWAMIRRIQLQFNLVVLCFGVFIGACGLTHFMEVWTLWHPDYWIAAAVKILTAVASVGTGLYLFKLRHAIVQVAEAAKLAEQRRLDLEALTRELERRVEERTSQYHSSEDRLNLALTSANIGFWEWNMTTGRVELSESLMKDWGIDPRTFGHTLSECLDRIHPDDREAARKRIEAVSSQEAGYDVEYRVVRPSGELIWVNAKGKGYRDATGKMERLSGVTMNITDRKKAEQVIEAQRQRFHRFTTASKIGVWYSDLPFAKLVWDETVKAQFWLPVDASVTIEDFFERIHSEDRQRIRLAIDESIRDETRCDVEFRTVPSADGLVYKWIRVLGWTDYDERGDAVSFDAITLDLTEDKAKDLARQRFEAEFGELLERTSEGFFTLAKDWTLSYANPVTRSFFELVSRGEIIGKSMVELFPSPDRSKFMKRYERVAATGRPEQFEESYADRVLQVHAYRRRDGGVAVFYRDVTDERAAEDRVKESESQFRNLADSIPQIAWMTDAQGRLQYLNQRWEEYTGTRLEQVEESGGIRLVHPDDVELVRSNWITAMRSGTGFATESRLLSKAGSYQWFLMRGEPVKDSNGRVIRWFGTNTDIHEQRMIRNQLEQRTGELESLIENSPIGIAFFDRRHRYLRVNAALARINGIPASAHANQRIEDIVPKSAEALHSLIDQVFKTGESRQIEFSESTPGSSGPMGSSPTWIAGFYPVRSKTDETIESVGAFVLDISQQREAEQSFRETAEKLLAVLDAANESIWIFSRDGTIEMVNRTGATRYGKPMDQIVGRKFEELLPPELARSRLEKAREVIATGAGVQFEDERAGIIFFHSYYPILDQRGSVARLVAFSRDITESKTQRLKLEASELRYRTVTEAIPQLVWTCLPDGNCDYLSQQWIDYTGIPLDRQLGLVWLDQVIHPDDRARTLEHWMGAVQGLHPYDIEYRIRRFDGVFRWFKTRGTPVRRGGEILYWFGTCTDIEEQKAIEKNLRESTIRFESIANSIPQLAWMTRGDGYITWYNQNWFDYTGTTLEEMQGWGWKAVHHPDHADRVAEKWLAHLRSGEPWEDIFPLKGKNGEWRWFLSRARAAADEEGQVLHWFGTNTDITQQLEDQERLSAAVQARDEFLSIASHELKTPLTSLQLQAQLVRRQIAKSDPSAYSKTRVDQLVDQTDKQVRRLVHLVEDMLDIARIRSGSLVLARERFDLCQLVNEVVIRMHPLFIDAGCGDPRVAPCDAAPVDWDRMRVEQVLTNLFTNAIRYGKSKPVEVEIRPGSKTTVLVVKDQGIGIAKEDQARIFDRFERAISAFEVSGLGLGLYISRQIVEAHGGRIWVESELGKGASFFVEIPNQA